MTSEPDKTPSKEKLPKALVYVHQEWVKATGAGEIFKSANGNPGRDVLALPVTHFDISDRNFVEIVFWPPVSGDQLAHSVKAFIPKEEISLIVELKSPETLSALGFKTEGSD
jgi:hypothetical protein